MGTSVALVGAVTLSLGPSLAAASVIVSLNNPGSTTLHEIWVEPGAAFGIDVNLATGEEVGWLQLALQASTSEVFDLLDTNINDPWRVYAGADMVGGIDGRSANGSFRFFGDPPRFGPGVSTVARVQISVDLLAPVDAYLIDVTSIRWTINPVTPELDAGQPGPGFVVHVIPEPASLCLLLPLFISVKRHRSG